MSRYKNYKDPPPPEHTTGTRMIEIEPGVWVDYLEWETEQNREERYWEGREVSPEDRAANLRKLDEIFMQHFGLKRKETR